MGTGGARCDGILPGPALLHGLLGDSEFPADLAVTEAAAAPSGNGARERAFQLVREHDEKRGAVWVRFFTALAYGADHPADGFD